MRAPRDDQKHLVSAGAVFRAQPVHRGAESARARSIEVGDLNNTHTVSRTGRRVRSTT